MSDRHLCKAKRTDNGEWIEGFYFCMIHDDGRHAHHFVIPLGADLSLGTPIEKIQVEIDPSTTCQCPGYKGIWEHDIFQYDDDWYQIEYDEVSLVWNVVSMSGSEVVKLGEFRPEEIDVIGNIFDNHELLEGGAEC